MRWKLCTANEIGLMISSVYGMTALVNEPPLQGASAEQNGQSIFH